MKLIKRLLGQPEETPQWDIKPPTERPAARKQSSFEESPKPASEKEKNPFLDDEMLDTIQLEAEAIPDDNPYQTHTWEQDLENDTRKLKTIQIGKATEKKPQSEFNPYDTSSMRRGWKK